MDDPGGGSGQPRKGDPPTIGGLKNDEGESSESQRRGSYSSLQQQSQQGYQTNNNQQSHQLSNQQQQQWFQQNNQRQHNQGSNNFDSQTSGQYQYNNPSGGGGGGPNNNDGVSFNYPSFNTNTTNSGDGNSNYNTDNNSMGGGNMSNTPGGGGGGGGNQTNQNQTPMGGNGFGNFNTQTPMTGASFGSSIGGPTPGGGVEGILKASNYGGGLLRGNDPLQPTPMIRRGDSSSQQQSQMGSSSQQGNNNNSSFNNPWGSGQQQQQQQSQQMHPHSMPQQRMKRNLDPVEEEDPDMLRYESRMDQSPMVGDGRSSKRGRMSTGGIMDGGSSHGDEGGGRSSFGASSSASQQEQGSQNTCTSSGGPSLTEFPFFFDGFAAWVCRHCQHIPPYYRGGNYVWQANSPPPNQVVDLHLRFCPGLNPGNMPNPASQQSQLQTMQELQQQMQGQHQSIHGMSAMSGQGGNSSYSYPMQQTMQGQNPFMMQGAQQQMMQQIQMHHAQQMEQQQNLSSTEHSSGSSGGQNISSSEHSQPQPDPPGMTSPQPPMKGHARQESEGAGSSGRLAQEALAHQQFQGQMPWHAFAGGGGDMRSVTFQNQLQQHNMPYLPYAQQMMQRGSAGSHFSQLTQHDAASSGGMMPMNGGAPRTTAKSKRKSTGKGISPKGRRTDDATYKASIDSLMKKTVEIARPSIEGTDVGQSLIDQSDADLLTDYFYHMMQQLVVCRFSEKDRKTRGGKREKINIGYGGLQCIHCVEAPSARKFFWSTVDRLANSFAEIPSHVLKCKHCPEKVKDALLALKGRHPDQMQMLPRGSQKVFFRRMWRRLHDGDREAGEAANSGVSSEQERRASVGDGRGMDPPTSASADAALKSPTMGAPAAATLLKKSLESQSPPESSGEGSCDKPKKKRERVLLAIPEDKDWLSDMDCFVRNNIEVFSSKQLDVESAAADRKYPIIIGQVGIRCIHCAMASEGARGAAVAYPYSISGIYESVREFQRLHLDSCQHFPKDLKAASEKLGTGAASLSSVLRRYYVQAARALGLFDTDDGGIRAGGTPVPMSTAGFQAPSAKYNRSVSTATGSVQDPERDPPEIEIKRTVSSPTEEGSETKQSKVQEDAPGKKDSSEDVKQDAPAKGEVPGKADAPGTKA